MGGGSVEIDASASSQFVSALLLAAPRMERGLDLRHVGPPVPSSPHIAMTVEVLRAAGIAGSTRGEQLSLEDFARISDAVGDLPGQG